MARSFSPIIAVIGLGYVGLPLAVEFGKLYKTIGFDLSREKIDSYRLHVDPTGEVTTDELRKAMRQGGLEPTDSPEHLASADFLVVAVPTPVDEAHSPDFDPLINASMMVGKYMKRGSTVIYESTVYPGATEEICVPLLEQNSNMKWKSDFNVAYSPERINPGDRIHSLSKILKIVSGDAPETLERVALLYQSIISAGVHRASSIKVAEAAKVIENTQRDLNIALMNELAIIFDRIGINTNEVLEAAGTKWNFLKFRPGLVGGHCIGVDPYYLTYKAEMLGYHPQVILAGRRINDGMGKFIAEKTIKRMIQRGCNIKGARVIVMGVTFKEDCPDLRNSKVVDVIRELESFGCVVSVHDPIADQSAAVMEYGLSLASWDQLPENVEAIVIAVAHRKYRETPFQELLANLMPGGTVVDVKGVGKELKNIDYWSL